MADDDAAPKCDYFLREALADVCSSHGVCEDIVPNSYSGYSHVPGACICDVGWHGDGDLMGGGEYLDCHVSLFAYKLMWGISLVVHALLTVTAVYILHQVHQASGKTPKERAALVATSVEFPYVSSPFMKKKAGNKTIIFCLFYVWSRSLDCVLRLANSGYQHSGNNFAICFFHAAAGFLFWGLTAPHFCDGFLSIIVKQAKMGGSDATDMNERLKSLHDRLNQMILPSFLAYFMLFLSYFFKDPSVLMGLSFVYYFTHLCMSFFLVNMLALPVSYRLFDILNALPNPSEQTTTLTNAIVIFNREARNAGHFNTLVCVMFCVFPFLWNCQVYQIAFAWITAGPVIAISLYIMAPKEHMKNTNSVFYRKRLTSSSQQSTAVDSLSPTKGGSVVRGGRTNTVNMSRTSVTVGDGSSSGSIGSIGSTANPVVTLSPGLSLVGKIGLGQKARGQSFTNEKVVGGNNRKSLGSVRESEVSLGKASNAELPGPGPGADSRI
jgi:hypothetical protein